MQHLIELKKTKNRASCLFLRKQIQCFTPATHLVFLIINYLDLQCEQRGYFTRVHPHLSETMFPVSRIYCSCPTLLFLVLHRCFEETPGNKRNLLLFFRRKNRALWAMRCSPVFRRNHSRTREVLVSRFAPIGTNWLL